MKKLFLFIIASLLIVSGFSQTPQRELRGTWLATVSNIDWPKSNDMATQKQELITILEKLETMNMNAVFLQVRPYSDAFYNSAYEPWSSYITGTRGKNPGYDPLQFAIDEAHKRGIEIHAWMNPYRASSNSINDCIGAQASWFMNVDSKTYYNPGVPEVTTYITNIVTDLVGKYELDGVIFDDYFYPEAIVNEDATAFANNNPSSLSLKDFRRASVNSMIKAVNTSIKAIKSDMRFGVAPFGVYTNTKIPNQIGVPVPSGVSGWDVYNTIYCDALAWFEDDAIDYISPQLYWEMNDPGQNYDVLTEWWGKVSKHYGKHCYPSIGVYRLATKSKSKTTDINGVEQYAANLQTSLKAYSFQEIVDEINVNRDNEVNNVYGSVFYSTKQITGSIDGLGEYIKENAFQEQALFQELSWLTSAETTIPTNLVITQGETVSQLSWTGNDPRYAVFGIKPEAKAAPTLLKMVFTESFSLQNVEEYSDFAVAGVNNKGELGTLSTSVQISAPALPVLVSPLGTTISSSETFTWNTSANATSYTFNIYSDDALTTQVYTEKLIKNSFAFSETVLQGQETYYWEVVATNAIGTNKSVSASFTTGFPTQAVISNIANNETGLAIAGDIEFSAQAEATAYYVQLSRDASFYITQIVFEKEVSINTTSYSSLLFTTDYYARVYAKNANGNGKWSEVIHFTTLANSLAAPEITAPTEAQFIDDSQVSISWNKVNTAIGYRMNIANEPEFTTVIHTQDFDSYTRTLSYAIEFGKKYYLRIASKASDNSYGAWSETRYFTNKTPNGIESALLHNMKIFPNPVEHNLNIELADNQSIKNIRIYSITGGLLMEQNFQNNKINLNLSDFPSGIYQGIIRTSEKKDFSFRFIKK